ncbi:MAG: ATP-binding protein [Pseudomonadota bacterium]
MLRRRWPGFAFLKPIGFAGRMTGIVLLVAFIMITLAVTAEFLNFEKDRQRDVPLTARIASIVDMLDASDVRQRKRIIKAVRSSDLKVTLAPDRPAIEGRRVAVAEWVLAQELAQPSSRDVVVMFRSRFVNRPVAAWLDSRSAASISPLLISVRLNDGSYAQFKTFGSAGYRIFGVPPGFGIGIIGAVLAIIAVWVVRREARPLKALRASVDAFARDAAPRPVTERGAPDIQRLIVANNTMQARIAHLVSGRTVMIGAISHDLRTYLTRLRLRVEMLSDADMRARAARDLDAMATLLDEALRFAEHDHNSPESTPVDVVALLNDEIAQRPSATIRFAGPAAGEPAVLVSGGDVALQRLFTNLLDNAARYASSVHISFGQLDNTSVRIDVDDDGPGIPVHEREAVFEPFHRLEASRNRDEGGTGLGLAIARQVATRAGGTLTIGESPLGGARFSVTLPRASLAVGETPGVRKRSPIAQDADKVSDHGRAN